MTADLARLDHHHRPASKETIIRTLAGMGSLFGAAPPDEIGMDLYVAALSRLPRQVFALARETLVSSHRYPSLPKPVEFIEAGQPEQDRINAVYQVVRARLLSYETALHSLHIRSNTA